MKCSYCFIRSHQEVAGVCTRITAEVQPGIEIKILDIVASFDGMNKSMLI